MTESILLLTMGDLTPPLARHPVSRGRVVARDLYDLPRLQLGTFRGLLLGMSLDQRFLQCMRPLLDEYVMRDGGRIVACGQTAYPYVTGLSVFTPLPPYTLQDLVVTRAAPHSIWEGVAAEDLTFRRDVAGFYGRGHHDPPPEARIVNTLGPGHLPLDFVYRLGAGEVLVRGGNDPWFYADEQNSAARMTPQLLDWIVS